MAQQGFTVAFIWASGAQPEEVGRCVERLVELVPAQMAIISVTVADGAAGLNLQLHPSLYSGRTLAELKARALQAGGRFIGLLQLVAPSDGELAFNDFETAADALRAALTPLAVP